jgi:hypothetical protein
MKDYTKEMTQKKMVEAVSKKVAKASPIVKQGLHRSLKNMPKKELNRWLNKARVNKHGDIDLT